jgi:hypothetical protein
LSWPLFRSGYTYRYDPIELGGRFTPPCGVPIGRAQPTAVSAALMELDHWWSWTTGGAGPGSCRGAVALAQVGSKSATWTVLRSRSVSPEIWGHMGGGGWSYYQCTPAYVLVAVEFAGSRARFLVAAEWADRQIPDGLSRRCTMHGTLMRNYLVPYREFTTLHIELKGDCSHLY